ncbi:MAG: hypothetical protein R6V57_19040 [Vicinamibacterales bacterium]
MSKKTLLTAIVAVALVVPLAGQKVKVPKPPASSSDATCTIEQDVNSIDPVQVGRDVRTYGPPDQPLYISDGLLPPTGDGEYSQAVAELRALGPDSDDYYGPYYGQIRVLDDRIDYFFDTAPGCDADNTAEKPCRFRAIVVDGTAVYTRVGKTKVLTSIAFEEGRYLLAYRPCDPAVDPVNCYVQLYGCYDDRDCPGVLPDGEGYVYATVNVLFQQ